MDDILIIKQIHVKMLEIEELAKQLKDPMHKRFLHPENVYRPIVEQILVDEEIKEITD